MIPMQLKHSWFEQVDDFLAACEMVLRTAKRKKACDRLPPTFTFAIAANAVKGVMSEKAFSNMWVEMKNVKLILPVDQEGTFRKTGPKK